MNQLAPRVRQMNLQSSGAKLFLCMVHMPSNRMTLTVNLRQCSGFYELSFHASCPDPIQNLKRSKTVRNLLYFFYRSEPDFKRI